MVRGQWEGGQVRWEWRAISRQPRNRLCNLPDNSNRYIIISINNAFIFKERSALWDRARKRGRRTSKLSRREPAKKGGKRRSAAVPSFVLKDASILLDFATTMSGRAGRRGAHDKRQNLALAAAAIRVDSFRLLPAVDFQYRRVRRGSLSWSHGAKRA